MWVDASPAARFGPHIECFGLVSGLWLLIHIIVIIAEAGLDRHYPATSSIRVGSSSPVPVLLTRLETGHRRMRSSAAGLRSSVPASPLSHGPPTTASPQLGCRN